jgi:hypothetical protein
MRKVHIIATALLWAVVLHQFDAHPQPLPSQANTRDFIRAYVSPAERVQQYMVEVCSGPLVEVLLRDAPAQQVKKDLYSIARSTYYQDVLNQPVPSTN